MTPQQPARSWWPQSLSSRLALVSALQLLLVAGSLSALSFALGRRSGLQLSEAYRQNASVVELSTRLSRKLNYPLWINALNLLELQQDHADGLNLPRLTQTFWRQMQVFPVDYINVGTANGEFLGLERTASGALRLNEDSSRSGRGAMSVYAMGPQGERGQRLERIPAMEPFHMEAWYVDTVRAGKPSWSSIYAWEDQPEVFSISYNAPVLGPGRQLKGVVGVDVVLSHLSSWLESVWRQRQGLALIVEPSGLLVASSRPSDTLIHSGGSTRRSSLLDLKDPLAQALADRYAERGPDGRSQIRANALQPQARPQRISLGHRQYTVAATPWGSEEGLQWVLLTALAADPSTTSTERAALVALLFSAAALGLAVLLTNRQIRGLLQPLRQLEGASARLSDSLGSGSRDDLAFVSGVSRSAGEEVVSLDGAMTQLVEQFNALTTERRRLMERERYRDAQTLALLKDKLSSSLQAAAVAHEINQPLSVVLLNSQLLLQQSTQSPEGTGLPQAWRQQLENISSEAQRVVLTIEKMRTLLRNVQTEHRPIDLREVALSAVLYARSATGAARLGLDSSNLERPSPSPAWIEGDGAQIQIAIVNLLRNACEALVEADVQDPWIGISLSRHGAHWVLAVADNGPGFRGDETDAAPLHTTKAEGSGLGLFVVRTTMQNHHGCMDLGRSEQGGALVELRFTAR
ncbi:ATP-binding protein [Vulcanococcus limneticus]|uniref:ATP-binding protein n=1 Tax=Vulcanococcus limneticus TaxID=2170428 RepID=UPI00398BE32C